MFWNVQENWIFKRIWSETMRNLSTFDSHDSWKYIISTFVCTNQRRWDFEKWSQNQSPNILKNFIFCAETFKKLPPHLLWTLQTCWRYLKRPPNTDFCVNEKIATIRHNMILCQEKSKKLKFWKTKSKVWFEYSDKPQFLR